MSEGEETPSLSENEYFVEKILDKMMIDGKEHYLIKWENYPLCQSTWEPKSNLRKSQDLIRDFEVARAQTTHPAACKSASKSDPQIERPLFPHRVSRKCPEPTSSLATRKPSLKQIARNHAGPTLQPGLSRNTHSAPTFGPSPNLSLDPTLNPNTNPNSCHSPSPSRSRSQSRNRSRSRSRSRGRSKSRSQSRSRSRSNSGSHSPRPRSTPGPRPCLRPRLRPGPGPVSVPVPGSGSGLVPVPTPTPNLAAGLGPGLSPTSNGLSNPKSAPNVSPKGIGSVSRENGRVSAQLPQPSQILGVRKSKTGPGVEYALEWNIKGTSEPLRACCTTDEIADSWPRMLIDFLEKHIVINEDNSICNSTCTSASCLSITLLSSQQLVRVPLLHLPHAREGRECFFSSIAFSRLSRLTLLVSFTFD